MDQLAAELKEKVKRLQSSTVEPDMIVILNELKKASKINEKLLRDTRAGLAVGKLRNHNSKEIADLAKEIVKKWKTEVEKEKQGGGSDGKSEARKPTPALSTASMNSAAATPTASTPSTPIDPSKPRSAQSDGVKVNQTGDRTRDTCTKLIYDALASDSGSPSELILKRSVAIEAEVFKRHDYLIKQDYRNKMRSLFSNLKDKSNPGLRESVVSGALRIDRLCSMTSQDMASEERKAADKKIKEDNIFNSLAAGEVEAETDAFQCGKCKQRKTRYRQAQTRSADEPMTTFVTCTNCNNRWKFS